MPERGAERGDEAAALRRLARDLTDIQLWLEHRYRAGAIVCVDGLHDGCLSRVWGGVLCEDQDRARRAAADCRAAIRALGYAVVHRDDPAAAHLVDAEGRDASAHLRLAAVARIEAALAAAGVRLPPPGSGEG